MGLLDSLKSTFTSSGEASVPPAASFATREGVIYAPVNGVLVNLSEVPDETIASGMLGQGYGIEPITGTIYAPANGRIGATTVTNHSIGMITEDGLRVFIHVGLGTVEMNGKGFARFVEMGDTVKAGQPLISFDRDAIKAAGHEDIVTVIVSELDRLKSIDHVGESGTLIGGNPLVRLGDPAAGSQDQVARPRAIQPKRPPAGGRDRLAGGFFRLPSPPALCSYSISAVCRAVGLSGCLSFYRSAVMRGYAPPKIAAALPKPSRWAARTSPSAAGPAPSAT